MSLIRCPECNKEISDKAKMCPHCGYELPKHKIMHQGIYCPGCLESTVVHDDEDEEKICPSCHIKYEKSIIGTLFQCFDYGKDNYEELRKSPKFNEKNYQKRVNWVPISYSSSSAIKCPTCQSTNVQRISGGERTVSVALFGLFSNKMNKSFKCNNCGYTW